MTFQLLHIISVDSGHILVKYMCTATVDLIDFDYLAVAHPICGQEALVVCRVLVLVFLAKCQLKSNQTHNTVGVSGKYSLLTYSYTMQQWVIIHLPQEFGLSENMRCFLQFRYCTVSTVQLHFFWLFSYLLTICLHSMLKFCFSSFFSSFTVSTNTSNRVEIKLDTVK